MNSRQYLALILVICGLGLCSWSLVHRNTRAQAEKAAQQAKGAHISVNAQRANRAPASAPRIVPTKMERREQREGLSGFQNRLARLQACSDGTCKYPKTDPKSYEFARGQDLKKTLFEYAEWVRDERLQLPEVAATAREFLGSSDGHVQEAALDLLSTQPTSPENLDAVINDVLNGYDPELIEAAMLELERYNSHSDLTKVDQAFANALLTGAPFVAREVSARLSTFLNPDSISFFKDLAQELPEKSVYRDNLEKVIAQYAQNG